MPKYTVRVYAIIISEKDHILLLNETFQDRSFTKFPGGGLEDGEGTLDALRRELKEELNLDSFEVDHFYTTDFFIESAFHKDTQVLSVYYKLRQKVNSKGIILQTEDQKLQSMKWISLRELNENSVTFPIDKKVVGLILS